MKKTAALFLCIFMVCAFMVGCKGIPCMNCEKLATLQGTIFDAINGERIGGDDMQIYLVQGEIVRNPTTYNDGEKRGGFFGDNQTAALIGDYSFTNIPAGSYMGTEEDPVDPENNEYRIVVIKAGYQRFEGIVDLYGYDNQIGNIYLFPEDYFAPDYKYTVVYNGKPVPNATVMLQPTVATNVPLTSLSHRIPPENGYLESVQAITNAAGQVKFEGSDLGLGTSYKVKVYNLIFEGVQLTGPAATNIVVGASDVEQIINLVDMCDTIGNNYCLEVVSISNSVADQVDASGILTIKFNRAVTLGVRAAPATADFTAALAVPSAAVWPAPPASRVTAALSDGGLTLTLTPAWTTPPALATEFGQAITYSDNTGFLSVVGYPDSSILLSTLTNVNGDPISKTVQLSTP